MYKKTISILVVLMLLLTGTLLAAEVSEGNQEPVNAAVVNGEEISMVQLNSFMKLDNILRSLFQVDQTLAQVIFGTEEGQALLNKFRENKLEQLIIDKLLVDKSQEEINMPQEEKDKLFNEHIQQIKDANDLTEEDILNELKQQNINSLEQYKSIYINQIIFERFQEKIMNDVTVSEEEAKDYYENNSSQFSYEESVDVSHILFRTEDRSEAEAKAEAEKIIDKLESGADFAELAKEYSESPTADNGGNLGFITKNDYAFAPQALTMEAGEISDPIKTESGYEVVKVNDKKEAGVKSFNEVKSDIESGLLEQKQSQAWNNYVQKLREEADVEINI